MKDRKHTHTGSCQICGAAQAVGVKTSLLAKHGYTTRWGFFSGVCSGSDELPYELDCSLIEAAIARAEKQLADTRAAAKALRARTGNVGFYDSYEKDPRTGKSGHYIVECSFRDLPRESDGYKWNVIEGTYTKHFMKDGQKVVVTDSGPNAPGNYSKSAAEAAKKSREVEAHKLDGTAKQIVGYIEWQTPRVTNWKLAALTPVAAEPVAIKAGLTFSAYDTTWTVEKLTEEYSKWGSGRCMTIVKAKRASDGRICDFRPQDVRKFITKGV